MSALLATTLVAADEAVTATDVETWNAALSYYEGGDVTNALRLLRPLMLTPRHGDRAAEVVAKIEHERGNREEAAAAAQIALRAHPDDPRANRNFTRATDGLVEARRQAHVDEVLKKAQGRDPGEMIRVATADARSIWTESGTYRTNRAAVAVARADALACRAERLADVWLPVRACVVQSVTNEEQAATILARLDQAESATKLAARQLGDLDGEAYGTLSRVESDFTAFLKMTAMPPAALDEDRLAQTNAWQDVETVNGRPWQPEALDFTRTFRAKFPAWARAYEQQAQSDTNKPPFTAEDQAKISALATELEKVQLECVEKQLPAQQRKALDLIEQMRALMPKDKNSGGGGSGSPQASPQDRQQPQQDEPKKDQENKDDSQQDLGEQEREPSGEEEKKPDEQQADAEESEETPDDKDVQAVLQKAQERADEHEAEKKARMRKAPLPPNERDW